MNKSESGFTFVELLVVVVIIGILTAIAIPNYYRMKDRAYEASVKSNMHTIRITVLDFATQANGIYPINLSQTVSQADPTIANNNNSLAGEEPANGLLGAGALLPSNIKNPIFSSNNIAQTEHPAPAWDQAHAGSCTIDFIDENGNQAAGSPSNARQFIITGYNKSEKIDFVIK